MAAPASLAALSWHDPPLFRTSACAPKSHAAPCTDLPAPQSTCKLVSRAPITSTAGMQLPIAEYTEVHNHWKSKSEAYEALGINRAIQGYKATVLKHTHHSIFLICHRFNLGCGWKGALVCTSGDEWELRIPPGSCHNADITGLKGNSGFITLEQREQAKSKLLSSVVVKPRMALCALRGDDRVDDTGVDLPKMQQLKKQIIGCHAKMKQNVGDLAKASNPHVKVPVSDVAGYLIQRKISIDPATNKPKVVLVATTKKSLRRWAEAGAASLCAVDGGYKYCLLGWPLTLLGVINEAGHMAVVALILTSDMSQSIIEDAFASVKREASLLTGHPCTKKWGMCDGEPAYRQALGNCFSSEPLMCAFHWMKAVRQYWFRWARLANDEKQAVWSEHMHPDLRTLNRSQSPLEVRAKWSAISKRWDELGFVRGTSHFDKHDREHHIVNYFEKQWIELCPGWHGGHSCFPLANTNNACESQIGHTRDDFGNVPGTATQLLRFMLQHVSFFAKEQWENVGRRAVDDALWQRAMDFKKLHHSPYVRVMQSDAGVRLHVCWGRLSDDVTDRRPMSVVDAKKIIGFHSKLIKGEPVTYDQLELYNKARVFSPTSSAADAARAPDTSSFCGQCSCPAFHPDRRCLHTLSFRHAPIEANPTSLMVGVRGRKRKAGDCHAGPDDYLPRRKANGAIAKLQSLSAIPIGQAGGADAAVVSIPAAPRRRLRWKSPARPQAVPANSFVSVPPDGYCLAYCIVAGRNLAKFMATPRDDNGVPLPDHQDQRLADLAEARQIVEDVARVMARSAYFEGHARISCGQIPEGADVEYYAQHLGGRICVVSLGYSDYQGPQYYGTGELKLIVGNLQHVDSRDAESVRRGGVGHFVLIQTFIGV